MVIVSNWKKFCVAPPSYGHLQTQAADVQNFIYLFSQKRFEMIQPSFQSGIFVGVDKPLKQSGK